MTYATPQFVRLDSVAMGAPRITSSNPSPFTSPAAATELPAFSPEARPDMTKPVEPEVKVAKLALLNVVVFLCPNITTAKPLVVWLL
jgi:hypothetical protein